jgi:hypothetical protein
MKLLPIERRFAQAVLEGFAPTTTRDGLAPLEGEVDYVAAFTGIADSGTDRARVGIRAALWLVALAPIWLGITFSTMAGLPQEKRAAILDRMLNSSAFIPRELALLIKISAAFALMSTRSIRARTNYDRKAGQASVLYEPVLAKSPLATKKPARALPVLVTNRASNPGVA